MLDDGVEIIAVGRDDRADRRRDGGAHRCSVAALTVYDMAKAIDKQMTFAVELVEKVKE